MKKSVRVGSWALVVFAALWLGGCRGSDGGSAAPASASPSATAVAGAAVAQVVFVGQGDACPCTTKNIAATFEALEKALAERPKVALVKLQLDVDKAEAQRYDELSTLMAPPGVYLLDAEGKLIQMLQGKLTLEQLQKALGPAS